MTEDTPPRVVVVSNRGPLSWRRDASGELVAGRGAGGLVSALTPALESTGGTWIAAAMTDADREVPVDTSCGYRVRLLDIDPDAFSAYREVVADGFLWFAHHDLWDRPRTPVIDAAAHEAWASFREVNELFAEAALDEASHEPGPVVVAVQDYHLALVPGLIKVESPETRVMHFAHTPFGTLDSLGVLPEAWLRELLHGLSAADLCGFHTRRWADRFWTAAALWAPEESPSIGVFPLGPDPTTICAEASSEAVAKEVSELERELRGRRCIVRVDRAELSKNVLRGLMAYDELLHKRPDFAESTAHVVLLNPSRRYEAYRRYLDECISLAQDINTRHGDVVLLHAEDRFARSLAAYRRADVVVVNPISDGMNLVAKESALVNEHDAALVLSTEAGAHEALQGACLSVDPYDVTETAAAMERALDMEPSERAALAADLRRRCAADPPSDWLAGQLAAIGGRP